MGYYKEIIKTRILSDKVLNINERYRSGHYNPNVFEEL